MSWQKAPSRYNTNRVKAKSRLFIAFISLLVAACAGAGSTVNGTLKPKGEDDSIVGRQIILCKIVERTEDLPSDCVLEERAVVSDDQGTFQIGNVVNGEFFVFYDSGLSDFESGLEQWGGKTLQLSDVEWIAGDYCGTTVDDMTIHVLAGMSIIREGILRAVRALYVCNSPFVMALDPNGSENMPLVVDVAEPTVEIKVEVNEFR